MKLLLLQQYKFTALGPMYISSYLKSRGHQCSLLIEPLEKDFLKAIIDEKPDLIGFQVFTGQHQWALQWASKIKETLEVPILFGGNHPTHNPDILQHESVDYICRGEGEKAIADVMDHLKSPQKIRVLKNINYNPLRNLVDIDKLPFPDRELYYKYPSLKDNSIKRFITSRGCPYQCTFCHNHLDMALYKGKGQWARKRDPALVIKEIEEVRSKYPLKIVDFSPDDYFFSSTTWAIRFLRLYRAYIGLPFTLNTRPGSITSRIAWELKSAGCRGVAISVESANDYLRNDILKKQTNKKDMHESMKQLRSHGILTKTYNMIGLPGESLKQALETVKLNIELKPTWARCAIISPYPNTKLWDIGVGRGFLKDVSPEDFSDNYCDDMLFKNEERDQLINLQRFFPLVVRFPKSLPLVKWLIKWPRNMVFDKLGRLFFGYYAVKYWGYSVRDICKYGWYFIKTGQPI